MRLLLTGMSQIPLTCCAVRMEFYYFLRSRGMVFVLLFGVWCRERITGKPVICIMRGEEGPYRSHDGGSSFYPRRNLPDIIIIE